LLTTALPAVAGHPAAVHCPVAPILSPPEIGAPWAPTGPARDWRPVAANPDAELWQGYRREHRAVDLYVGYYCTQRAGAEVVNQAHQLMGGEHWLIQAQGSDRVDAGAGELTVQTSQVRFAGQRRLVIVWYWVAGRFTADPLTAKLLQAKAALLGGPAAAAVLVASTPYHADASDARTTLSQALAAMALEDVLMRPGRAIAPPAAD
jgi:EpsI family protein